MPQTETTGKKNPPPLPTSLEGSRVLSARQGAELLGISVCTFRRLDWGGSLPAAVWLSTRRKGWRASDLLAYCNRARAVGA